MILRNVFLIFFAASVLFIIPNASASELEISQWVRVMLNGGMME